MEIDEKDPEKLIDIVASLSPTFGGINLEDIKGPQCEIVRGIGVNLEKFAFKPIKNHKNFIMVARLLKNKGVIEYCKCAEIVKQKYPEAVFNYLGSEGTVKLADIQKYINNGTINYLGVTNDVRPYLEDSSMLILPSYREGMQMLLEDEDYLESIQSMIRTELINAEYAAAATGDNFAQMFAAMVIGTAPMVILFIVMHKTIINNTVTGGLKG